MLGMIMASFKLARWQKLLGLGILSVCFLAPSLMAFEGAREKVPQKGQPNSASADKPAAADKANVKNWTMFRGNPAATGVTKAKLGDKLKVAWKFKVKNGMFDGSPIVHKGVVYIGEGNGTLLALSLESGEKLWQFPKEKPTLGFVGSAAFKNGLIYIGDLDGNLYCVNEKGEQQWKFQAEAAITSSVNFYKDTVIVGAEDAMLYCLDAKSGDEKWKFETADEIRCMPTVIENRAFVTGCDGALHIVDLDAGKEVVSVELEAQTIASPAVLGNRTFYGTAQNGFYAVDWKKEKLAWSYPDGDQIHSSPAVIDADGTKHVIYGSKQRKVVSLDAETGKSNWEFKAKRSVDASPVVAGDRVVALSTDGRLYLINLKDGKKIFEKQFTGGFAATPAVVDGKVIVATMRGTVYCLENE